MTVDINVLESETKELAEHYYRLGHAYYSVLQGEKEKQDEVDECVKKIDAYREKEKAEELAKIGRKLCPNCKYAVEIESVFCNMCGFRFSEAGEPQPGQNKKDDVIREAEKNDDIYEKEKGNQVSIPLQIPKSKHCTFCGALLPIDDPDLQFCGECGKRIMPETEK